MATHTQYTAAFKHKVLSEYQPNKPNTYGQGFHALATRYAIPDGAKTIHQWYAQWDGTQASLEHKPIRGRKRSLTEAESTTLILKPVQKAVEKKQKISYKDIHKTAIAKPQYSHISLRTIQQLGKKHHGLKWKRTTLTVALEGRYIHMTRTAFLSGVAHTYLLCVGVSQKNFLYMCV